MGCWLVGLKITVFMGLLTLSLGVFGQGERLSVLASIRPLALLVNDLAGQWVDVGVVVPANADPHSMSLKSSDRMKLDGADFILWLGADFERFLAKPLAQRKQGVDLAVVDIAGIVLTGGGALDHHEVLEAGEHELDDHHSVDLHVWLDPRKVELILRQLVVRLGVLRPSMKPDLELRLMTLLGEIAAAERVVSSQLQPFKGKGFGVYHNAYGHFSEAFDLRAVAAVNQMPEQRISAKHMYELQKDMVSASCLVVERKTPKTQRMAKVLKVKEVEVDPLAANKAIQSYSEFLLGVGKAFKACFVGDF